MTRTQYYKVAGYVFSLCMDDAQSAWEHLDNYSPFLTDKADTIFDLELVQSFEAEDRQELYRSTPEPGEMRIDIDTCKDGYVFDMGPFGKVASAGLLKVSEDFSKGSLVVNKDIKFCLNTALMLLFAFRGASLDVLEMHSSVTIFEGKAYMFLGKSGTGKSTHSSLWLKNIEGTHLMNDDNPVIRVVDGIAMAYGSPWSGKTPCYRNEEYPIGAIVRIRQAKKNEIHRMSLVEAYASVSSSSSGLRAIKPVADGLFATASAVVSTVPCYILDCLPDDDAARLCHSVVTAPAE